MAFDWVAAYNAASPGQTITVPGGTYAGFTLPYRAALAGQGSISNPASLVTFDCPDPVVVNGEIEIFGSCVRIKGRKVNAVYSFKVNGRILTITQSQSQHPDNVILETLSMTTLGCFSTENAIFRDLDVGPATVTSQGSGCYIKEGVGDENKIAARGFFVPKNILYEGVRIHHQNGDKNRELSDCHYGGLFLINADGLTFYRCIFEANVGYDIQVQNFSGPPAQNVTVEECAFGAPCAWAYPYPSNPSGGIVPNGQRCIQFSGSGQYPNWLLKNNLVANPGGLFGYYGGGTNSLSTVIEQGTVYSPTSPYAPGGGPPPPPPPPPPTGLTLRKVSETESKITLGWDPVPGAVGYRFQSAATAPKWSHTFDPTRITVLFSKGQEPYKVEALGVLDGDVYP